MFQTIVVGTDGSGCATRAVDLAARIAQRTGSTLLAVSVYADPSGDGGPLQAAHAGGIDVANGLLEDVVRHHGSDVKIETVAAAGDAADVILQLAGDRGAGLIVVGDRGMTGARRALGSVPNTISHHAPCHLLIAHTETDSVEPVPISKVLIGVDGSATALEAAKVGLGFADAMGASATLVTVGDAADGAKIHDRARTAIGRDVPGLVLQGSAADGIIAAAEAERADVVVTGSRGMSGARRLLGSVPNSVSHHAGCSVFIAKTV